MNYGALTLEDIEVLEQVLRLFAVLARPVRFLEIGIHSGATARGVKGFCDDLGVPLEYWGLDPSPCEPVPSFPGAHFVRGDSAESFHLVPDGLDAVLIDGCHCRNHVILDTLNYGAKVAPSGFLLFHDISPSIQHTMKDPHGPDIPEFHNSVLDALALLHFPFPPWVLFAQKFNPANPWGGMAAYRKEA